MIYLAWRNLFRNKTRTLLTSGGFSAGVVAYLILTSSLAGLVDESLIFYRLYLISDLTVVGGDINQENIGIIQEMKEVQYVEQGYFFDAVMKKYSIKVLAISPSSELFPIQKALLSGTLFKGEQDILLPERMAETLSIDVGDSVLLTFIREDRARKESFHVSGTLDTTMVGYNAFIVSEKGPELAEVGIPILFVNLNPRYPMSVAEGKISNLLKPQTIEKNETVFRSMRTQYNISYATATTLGYLIFLVAGLGILNTMTISVVRRKPEIGILRSLGMKTDSLFFMFLFEGVFIAVLGIFIGLGLVLCIVQFGKEYFASALILRATAIINVSLLALILAVLFSLYPAVIATRQSAMECLRRFG